MIDAAPNYDVGQKFNTQPRYQALLYALHAHNVTLSGGGTIDGNGAYWWALHRRGALRHGRPMLVQLQSCANVAVRGVRLTASPMYHVHILLSRNASVTHTHVEVSAASPNTDGVDIDSTVDALVAHNTFRTGDDCVAVKAGDGAAGRALARPSRNVRIANNTFVRGAGCAIGSEVAGGVRNVSVIDNVFHFVGNVARIKACARYGSEVAQLAWRRNTFYGASDALFIDACYECNCSAIAPTFRLTNLTFEALSGYALRAGALSCLPQAPCRISAHNIDITALKGFHCENVHGDSGHVHPKWC